MSEMQLPAPRPKRLVVVMDGTWNSPAKESEREGGDKVFKPSNPLKTSRAVKDLDDAAAILVACGEPGPGDTVRAGGKLYTFVETLDDVEPKDGQVKIAKGARDSLESLRYAINLRAHRGRYSKAMTRHSKVSARAVAGDRYRLEIVPSSGADAEAFSFESSVPGWRWIASRDLDQTFRGRALDPAEGVPQVVFYDVGVGGLRKTPGFSNQVHRIIDKAFGGARGAGFEANIENAYLLLALNYQPGDEIYLFGFSRGASSVRGLARFLDWMGGLVPSIDAYWIPRYFDAFLAGSSYAETRAEILEESYQRRVARGMSEEDARQGAEKTAGTVSPATVRFLGVWDSVLSIGAKREKPHVGECPPKSVEHARQAIAIDERRPDFEARVWLHRHRENPAQTLEQRWFCGVHSNIGGGYLDDGLANVALRWMLDEAREVGLALDDEFLSHYPSYAEDQIHDSSTLLWRVIQILTFRRSVGVRKIFVDSDAGLTLHPSVLRRLVAERKGENGREHKKLDPYRPENLCKFLAARPDLEAFLLEVDSECDEETMAKIRSIVDS